MSRPARIWQGRISKNQAASLFVLCSGGMRPQHGGVICNTKSSISTSIFISRAGKRGQENLPPMCMKKYAVRALRRRRPAILVLPGGSYKFVSPYEAEPVALYYFQKGFNAFVLDYDVLPHTYPYTLEQAAMAMMYIRKNRAGDRHAGKLCRRRRIFGRRTFARVYFRFDGRPRNSPPVRRRVEKSAPRCFGVRLCRRL